MKREASKVYVYCNRVAWGPSALAMRGGEVVIRRCAECQERIFVGKAISKREKEPNFGAYVCLVCFADEDPAQPREFGEYKPSEWREATAGLRADEVAKAREFHERITGKRPPSDG